MAKQTTRADVAHLLRRAGFGATPEQLDAAVTAGYEATVASLLSPPSDDPGLAGLAVPQLTAPVLPALRDTRAVVAIALQARREIPLLAWWWISRMALASSPLPEKMALLWHGHFATSAQKVRFARLMYDQNQLFRQMGMGDFEALTLAVSTGPAMLIWLDADQDLATHPNENFARELMELFTLGIGNYTEDDVHAAARAFTGWQVTRDLAFAFLAKVHDAAPKTFLGTTGNLAGPDIIQMVTHAPASARFIASKLWSHLAYPIAASDPLVTPLAKSYAADLNIAGLVRQILLHPMFLSTTARQGLVKQPIEYVAGALRALRPPLASAPLAELSLRAMAALGQVPFEPPNVGGWPQNRFWLSTATSLARLDFANSLARRSDLSAIEDAASKDRPDAVARLLAIDGWSAQTAEALRAAAGDPQQLVALALVSPELVMN